MTRYTVPDLVVSLFFFATYGRFGLHTIRHTADFAFSEGDMCSSIDAMLDGRIVGTPRRCVIQRVELYSYRV